MNTNRDEAWGQLVYQRDVDEFEAQVRSNVQNIRIDRPISAGCLLTGRCNLKCQYCYGNDESLPKKELPASEWARIFLQLKTWGVMRVDLSGGEPTIREDITAVAEAALSAGLNVIVSTNGLPLAKKGLEILPTSVRLHISVDSGFAEVHEASRIRRSLLPSVGSLQQITNLTAQAVHAGYRVRVLTCIGRHNSRQLVELGERLAIAGVNEWNISRVLAAGRAEFNARQWEVNDDAVLEEVHAIRNCYPWIRVRYSNRTTQNGYFLLVLPDGSLATQYTDGRDKVLLGRMNSMTLDSLRRHPDFDLNSHGRKWIGATTFQPTPIHCGKDSSGPYGTWDRSPECASS